MIKKKRESRSVKLTADQKVERDHLVSKILAAARALHKKHLIRLGDMVVEQDEFGPRSDGTIDVDDAGFYAKHDRTDYRLQVTLVVRREDR